jgi:hypothetical protein
MVLGIFCFGVTLEWIWCPCIKEFGFGIPTRWFIRSKGDVYFGLYGKFVIDCSKPTVDKPRTFVFCFKAYCFSEFFGLGIKYDAPLVVGLIINAKDAFGYNFV